MKKLLAISFFILNSCILACSQTISTAAGVGTIAGYSGDWELATVATLHWPFGVAFDASGNLFIADEGNQVIRMVNTSGTINTVVGHYNTSGSGYSGDGGPATAAELHDPDDIAFDASGNLYFSDWTNNVIREVNTSGIINTVVGNGYDAGLLNGGYTGDGGPARAAELYAPTGIAFDASGNLYIADAWNNVIRMVNSSGMISSVVGNPVSGGYSGLGYSGDGGPATTAELSLPIGICIGPSGNLYIADAGNKVIRMVNASGIISTFAGRYNGGFGGYSGDGGLATEAELIDPRGVAFDSSGNLYIADEVVVRKVNTLGIISTVVGNYNYGAGFSGDGGAATAAELDGAYFLAFDVSGNLYFSDEMNDIVRKVSNTGSGIPSLQDENGQIIIYPNPSNGMFTIAMVETPCMASLQVYNIMGQKIFSQFNISNPTFNIDLSNQPNGVYLYRVLNENGGLIGEGKAVKD